MRSKSSYKVQFSLLKYKYWTRGDGSYDFGFWPISWVMFKVSPNHSFKTRSSSKLGFRDLIGSSGWPGHNFFKKNQNDAVLVKKTKINKSQSVCGRVLTGSYRVSRVTLGFSFFYFFFNPTRFQSRVDPTAGPGFKTMVQTHQHKLKRLWQDLIDLTQFCSQW